MALSPKQLSMFLTLAVLSIFHAHARDSQFFNKVPSTTNTVVIPTGKQQEQQQQPEFLPEDENNYGLYGHESGQLPPSTTNAADNSDQHKFLTKNYNSPTYDGSATAQNLPKYLPKNYNPVAYVTVPEGTDNNENDSNSPNDNGNNVENYNANNNDDNDTDDDDNVNYFNSQQLEQERAYRNYPTNVGGRNYNRGGATGFRPEGMSDTRSLENGKYFYDVGTGNFASGHPYERLRGSRRNYYGSQESSGYRTDHFSGQDFLNEDKYNTP